jgi:hypothetical protein
MRSDCPTPPIDVVVAGDEDLEPMPDFAALRTSNVLGLMHPLELAIQYGSLDDVLAMAAGNVQDVPTEVHEIPAGDRPTRIDLAETPPAPPRRSRLRRLAAIATARRRARPRTAASSR